MEVQFVMWLNRQVAVMYNQLLHLEENTPGKHVKVQDFVTFLQSEMCMYRHFMKNLSFKVLNSFQVGRRRTIDFVSAALPFIKLMKKQNQLVPMN